MRCCLIVVLLTGVVCAEESSKPVDRIPVRIPGQTAEQLKLRQQHHDRMAKPIDVAFKETPLNEAVAEIFQKIDVPVRLDETALEEEGIQLDEPVTLTFKQCPARTVLHFIELHLDLAHSVRSDGVTVTAQIVLDDLTKYGELWIYDVSAIVGKNGDLQNMKANSLRKSESHVWLSPAPVAWQLGAETGEATTDFTQIISLVQQSAGSPDSWANVNGGEGTIQGIDRSLIVRQSPAVLHEIDRVLEAVAELMHGDRKAFRQPLFASDRELVEKLQANMQTPVTLDVTDVPLNKVIGLLLEPHTDNIHYDWRALEEEGISQDWLEEKVSYQLAKTTLHEALSIVLDPLDLTVLMHRGVPVITTKIYAEDLSRYPSVVFLRIDQFPQISQIQFIILFQEFVGTPDAWANVNGGEGTIDTLGTDLLVIRTTEANGRKILELMETFAEMYPAEEVAMTPVKSEPFPLRFYQFFCEEAAKRQVENLPKLVQPETWKQKETAIARDGDTLAIRQTREGHDAIEKYLTKLEQAPGNRCFFDPRIEGDNARRPVPSGFGSGLGGLRVPDPGGNFFSSPPND